VFSSLSRCLRLLFLPQVSYYTREYSAAQYQSIAWRSVVRHSLFKRHALILITLMNSAIRSYLYIFRRIRGLLITYSCPCWIRPSVDQHVAPTPGGGRQFESRAERRRLEQRHVDGKRFHDDWCAVSRSVPSTTTRRSSDRRGSQQRVVEHEIAAGCFVIDGFVREALWWQA